MIKLVTNNPYRILGVYSNSPKKDVLSNLNKMKAFLKVGKAVSFPLDLPQLLPSINRDDAIASSAQSAIELPIDQVKHTLFWFMKATPLDDIALNHLISGNIAQAKEIWNKKESVSSLLNLMVCAMIESDLASLSIKADNLFQNYVGDFCLAVNETIKLTSSQLTELFVELLKADGSYDLAKMMQVPGTSAEWRKVLGGGIVEPIIDGITAAITEAKSAKGPLANYRAGEKLMNSTKGNLTQLRSIIGSSDMQYQMIADKLATTILQCGINYFNDIEADDAVEKAMILQNYALSIAVGQMAKDRCKENVDILQKIGPEYKVRKEIERLGKRLTAFKNKEHSAPMSGNKTYEFSAVRLNSRLTSNYKTSDVKDFITECQTDLLSIEKKLGANNSTYRQISSAVASVAINAVIDIVNKAQSYASLTRNPGDLVWSVMEAVGVMDLIGRMTMNDSCQEYYRKNYSTLCSIKNQLMPKSQPSSSSGGCYIATMAYGDYDHPQVMVLRQFRDSYLSKRLWGQKFINFYYANSPSWVEKLKDHKRTNAIIRKMLDLFVSLWKKTSYYE